MPIIRVKGLKKGGGNKINAIEEVFIKKINVYNYINAILKKFEIEGFECDKGTIEWMLSEFINGELTPP